MNGRMTLLFGGALVAMIGRGCTCGGGTRPQPITPPVVSPATTGEKIRCECQIGFSAAVQMRTAVPPVLELPLEVCVPSNFDNRESEFCRDAVSLFARNMAERLALHLRGDNPEFVVCGGGGGLGPAIETVTCTQQPLLFRDGIEPVFSVDEPQCLAGCPVIPCNLTTDPALPAGTNCLARQDLSAFNQCSCTVVQGCNQGSSPVCTVKPGGAVSQPLVASPMTAVTSGLTVATVDRTQSRVDIHVEFEVLCVPILGCVTVEDDASPAVAGSVNIYGGPCPGATCEILLEATLSADDFTLSFGSGPFNETHALTRTTALLETGDNRVAVGPDGAGIIPAGQLSFIARGEDNGTLNELRQTNPMPVPFTIDWTAGRLVMTDVRFQDGPSQAVLDLVATFPPQPLQVLARFADWDQDLDGIPDRLDNCPLVPNPTQAPVPSPTIQAPPDLVLATCAPADLGSATAVDVCFGRPVTVTNDAPATFLPGPTTVTWTAVDTAGNRATATQRVTVFADDRSCCPAGTALVLGTEGRDRLRGSRGRDCVLGLGGDDVIDALDGDDFISAGSGRDTVQGGPGDDVVLGGPDDDTLAGGPGDDQLDGGPGTDTCALGGGRDRAADCEVSGP